MPLPALAQSRRPPRFVFQYALANDDRALIGPPGYRPRSLSRHGNRLLTKPYWDCGRNIPAEAVRRRNQPDE